MNKCPLLIGTYIPDYGIYIHKSFYGKLRLRLCGSLFDSFCIGDDGNIGEELV